MPLPLLLQPKAHGRLSGGYLYNARMAEHGAWKLCEADPGELAEVVAKLETPSSLLIDSIWLTEAYLPIFLELAARGWRVGVMLHSFPSMIAAAESGASPRREPSSFEIGAIEQLQLCLVPGRHYINLLAGLGTSIRIAEPGIDDHFRAEPRPRSGPCRLVSVGAVTPRKGFLDIAEALGARRERDFTWSIVGNVDVDPDYAARVRQQAREIEGVEFAGQLSPMEVARRIRGADVFVMPSYDENQPLVLLEAMAASVPAVAYAAGAAAQMVEHEREGLIAPIGDKRLLSVYLTRLIEDEAGRHGMAVRCWERQRRIPTWPEAATRARLAIESETGGIGSP